MAGRPGITIAQLRDALGVGPKRIWHIVDRLERSLVRRSGDPATRLVPQRGLGPGGLGG